ncbi:MAG TPA: glycoside hydrolase family 15 protein [Kofleriaceae bacterium]|nr:glycoside hydrolase family 15 protein [Kofleriaceae bacterium]
MANSWPGAALCLLLCSCSSGMASDTTPAAELEPLDRWISRQEQRSWQHLLRNISPAEPKVAGGPRPARGIVVGALSKKDPDYYFHWIRDSSNVMRIVIEASASGRPYARPDRLSGLMRDFLDLTARLQATRSAHGLGEPRFTVEGKADTLPWSRPQFDGPALRALTVTRYLRLLDERGGGADARALQILMTDLDFVAEVWPRRGFDLWEEYNAENYHTRLVQLAALEKGAAYLAGHGLEAERVARYRRAAAQLEPLLDDHWDPARGFLRSQLVIVATDGYTAKKTDLDSAVVVAVMEADRDAPAHSVLDDRVQATVAVLEDLFRRTYPINARRDVGLGYGRYQGDVYYGGNPWFLITAYYAELYYRLARRLQEGSELAVTKRNLEFVRGLAGRDTQLKPGSAIRPGDPLHRELIARSIEKGDSILRRFQLHTPEGGQIYEQFDKKTGRPASSPGIGWGHSAFLSAAMERARLEQR